MAELEDVAISTVQNKHRPYPYREDALPSRSKTQGVIPLRDTGLTFAEVYYAEAKIRELLQLEIPQCLRPFLRDLACGYLMSMVLMITLRIDCQTN